MRSFIAAADAFWRDDVDVDAGWHCGIDNSSSSSGGSSSSSSNSSSSNDDDDDDDDER